MVKKNEDNQPATKQDIKSLADKTDKRFDNVDKKFEKTNKKIDDAKRFLSQEIIVLDKRIDNTKSELKEEIVHLRDDIVDLREEMWLKDKKDEARFKELKSLISNLTSAFTRKFNDHGHRIEKLEEAVFKTN